MSFRRTVAVAVAACASLALAAPAGAAKPVRIPLGPGSSFEDTDGFFCGFPISVEEVTNREVLTQFSDGSILVTGAYKVRITNLDDPSKSIVVNASGPQRDFVQGTGGQLLFVGEGEVFGGGIYLLRGNGTITRDDTGAIVAVDHNGNVSGNLCDQIA